jgi:hypothetical protein
MDGVALRWIGLFYNHQGHHRAVRVHRRADGAHRHHHQALDCRTPFTDGPQHHNGARLDRRRRRQDRGVAMVHVRRHKIASHYQAVGCRIADVGWACHAAGGGLVCETGEGNRLVRLGSGKDRVRGSSGHDLPHV